MVAKPLTHRKRKYLMLREVLWRFGNSRSRRVATGSAEVSTYATPTRQALRVFVAGVFKALCSWHVPVMPIVNSLPANPLVDGRQSERAMLVRRGVQRLLANLQAVCLPEVTLATGRRADLMVLTGKGDFWIVEIKSSIEDFRADNKWPDYREWCDRLFFATHPDVPQEIFPQDAGFVLSDGYGAEILREAPEHRIAPARRKALMTRFARTGAQRLLRAELAGIAIEPVDGD